MRDYGMRQNQAAQVMVKGINEGIEGFKEIRVLGKEVFFHSVVRRGAEEYCVNQRRFVLIQNAPRYLLEAVLILFVVLLVILTLRSESSTENLLGTLGLFGVASIRLLPIATMFAGTLTILRFNRDAVSRIFNDLKAMKDIPKKIRKFRNHLRRFRHSSFKICSTFIQAQSILH
uniref:Uncharacterized protein n=1 Tax=uncultured organism MedDCM-OCT-S11-C293 TaxID=743659 RepID=D6PLE0_9ZZZZ|nr:hypothetical protein [uncultured organism MedDCM-OCT-S11-C293]